MKRIQFNKIFQKHRDSVFSYAVYFLRNRDDAKDVTQDVFIKLWQYWDRIDRKNVVAWMMRVTHNRCVDLARRKKSSKNIFRLPDNIYLETASSEAGTALNPDLQFEFTETQKALLNALETLPVRTKSMLLMHYFQGLKYDTISKIMDSKVSTVKVTVHRGKKSLRKIIEKQFPELVR